MTIEQMEAELVELENNHKERTEFNGKFGLEGSTDSHRVQLLLARLQLESLRRSQQI